MHILFLRTHSHLFMDGKSFFTIHLIVSNSSIDNLKLTRIMLQQLRHFWIYIKAIDHKIAVEQLMHFWWLIKRTKMHSSGLCEANSVILSKFGFDLGNYWDWIFQRTASTGTRKKLKGIYLGHFRWRLSLNILNNGYPNWLPDIFHRWNV